MVALGSWVSLQDRPSKPAQASQLADPGSFRSLLPQPRPIHSIKSYMCRAYELLQHGHRNEWRGS